MIKFVIAINEDGDDKFETYLKPCLKKLPVAYVEIFNKDPKLKNNSIFAKYNLGIDYLSPKLSNDDIVCFCHSDIKIHDQNFIKKIELVFEKKPEVGVLGVIGTTRYDSNGWWHSPESFHRGAIKQSIPKTSYNENIKKLNRHKDYYDMVKKIGYFDDIMVVDGCFFCVRGKVAKEVRFREDIFQNFYHFYDVSFCFDVLEKGYKIAVAPIDIEHASPGPLDVNWNKANDILKYFLINKGYTFPVSVNDIKR